MTFYSIQEAADLVGINYQKLWFALVTGKLQETTKIGRYRLFDDAALADIKRFFGTPRRASMLDADH